LENYGDYSSALINSSIVWCYLLTALRCSDQVVCVEAWGSRRWLEGLVLERRVVLWRPCQGSNATWCV